MQKVLRHGKNDTRKCRRCLAVVLDGYVRSSATVQGEITGGNTE